MSRWFRVYDDLVDDPKVQRLPADTFRGLINLWCLASQNDGVLPPHADIAFKLRLTDQKATKLLDDLVAAGLLEHDETGVRPHNWDKRQHKHDSSKERVQRHRERKRNADVTVTATPPETETEQNTEADASGAEAPPDPSVAERELFDVGKRLLGKSAGGQITNLLRAKGGNVSLARAVIEEASTKQSPSEYVGAAIRGPRGGMNGNHHQPSVQDFARRLAGQLQREDAGEPLFGVGSR